MMTQENMLARYRILHEVGRGAMGAVYAARDSATGAVVALKVLDPALLNKSDANVAARFLKHARSARLLRHANIVRIHDAGEAAGTAYVAMEMLEGESLRKILDDGPLPIARAIRIAHDIACGLAHAHLEGVVHGGVKPSNIIVLRSGLVKITDFGIGRLGPAALLSEARAGRLSYMSPEQMRGDPIDHRCDIFSLGALFYEMLTRRPPFKGDSPKEIMENILHAEPPLPSTLNQHIPRALDAIVLSMLAGQPAGRMPGAPIVLRDLQRLEEGLGLGSGASNRAPMQDAPEELQQPNQITDHDAFDYHRAMERGYGPERSSGSRPAIFAALALVLAVIGIGIAGVMYYPAGPGKPGITASRTLEALETAPVASRPTAPPPVAEATKEPVTAPDAPQALPPRAVADGQAEQESLGEQPTSGGSVPAQQPPPAMQPTAQVPDEQPGGTARLILEVSPRGEIYVDGAHHGTTPPITTFDLEPGMHRIEVRSGSRKPYLTYMTVQAGDVRRIRHDFNAKARRPPT